MFAIKSTQIWYEILCNSFVSSQSISDGTALYRKKTSFQIQEKVMAIGVYKHCYNNFDIIVYNNYI